MLVNLMLLLLGQSNGDTLHWYDTTTVGYDAVALAGTPIHWAIIFDVDSYLDGRTVRSGRVNIWEPMIMAGVMRLCLGTHSKPLTVLDSGSFYATDSLSFHEVFFGDTIVLQEGDTVWLWVSQGYLASTYPATTDSGPAVLGYGDMISLDGQNWNELVDYGIDQNWVLELILTPLEAKEGSLKTEERIALTPAPGGFIISGYKGPARVYDPGGRLILIKEIKGKTRIGPLSPGVYFVVAGRQRAMIAVR